LWLESLEAPVIAAPAMRAGQSFRNYVPNNDLDAVGGNPVRVSEIRAPKPIRPILFEPKIPLLYVWRFANTPDGQMNAQRMCAVAGGLYQLGRGVDMAWARGEILAADRAEACLAALGGPLYRPGNGAGGNTLAVPLEGSLKSLLERYTKVRGRFQTLYESRPSKKEPGHRVVAGKVFVQPPKPRFRQVTYDSPSALLLFDLQGARASWRLDRIVELTERVRDGAAQRLKEKLPNEADKVRTVIVGQREASEADKAARLRITPLPSIGHPRADRAIRRVLIEIPPNSPLRADDIEWAFSGLLLVSEHGEILCELVTAAERGMLAHYGIEDAEPASWWRTVTPAALPQPAGRRRIDPRRRGVEAKGGVERTEEEGKAVSAVIQALRHVGVRPRPLAVRVQREPFESNGMRAEAFAPGSRFAKERLWHVEIALARTICGPIVLGDGRYLGLGVMAPVKRAGRDAFLFSLPPLRVSVTHRIDFARAVRRALMALSRDARGDVPRLFSGHEVDGSAARSGRHEHVFLAAADIDDDGYIDVLMIAAPWACDRSLPARGRDRQLFDDVVSSLERVRTGRLGVIELNGLRSPLAANRLLGPARHWESHTPYRPTRHAGRRQDLDGATVIDTIAECMRRGLPMPRVELLEVTADPYRGAVAARTRLEFSMAVEGPILLGRDSHGGGGLFLSSARLPPQE
jgi:CRISPR-associated protein Csb2